jgi:uncharacterized metal-binding protein
VAEAVSRIGIISCSGEEIPEGTIARQAVRRVLEGLRPQQTVTLCLPLFLAGDGGERRFAREHPTIAVDGCDKRCAMRGTEQHSGRVAASLVVTDVLGDRTARCHRSVRDSDKSDEEAVWILAQRIAAEVDAIADAQKGAGSGAARRLSPSEKGTGSASARRLPPLPSPKTASCGCAGSSPPPEGELKLNGKTVAVGALPLIFDHLYKHSLQPGGGCADRLLQTVRVYHEIPEREEGPYREALSAAYGEYCRQRTNQGESTHD